MADGDRNVAVPVDVAKVDSFSADELQFIDIVTSSARAPSAPPPDVTKGWPVETHTFNDFPASHDDSLDDDDSEDKASLLLKPDAEKQPSFWTFEYYQSFFDVDTDQVMWRIFGSMVPNPRANYLQTLIRPNPDLYGPFWICTTLVFTMAIGGNLANYIQARGDDYEWRYDFSKVTFAATAIFSYWWVVPTIIWALLWWRGSRTSYTFSEIICVYGYSLAVYIPVSILWVIQFSWLQWLLVLCGMFLSGSVLLITFWPAVRNDDKKVAYLMMALMLLFHGLLAVGFKVYFFNLDAFPEEDISPGILNTTTEHHTAHAVLKTTVATLKQSVPVSTATS